MGVGIEPHARTIGQGEHRPFPLRTALFFGGILCKKSSVPGLVVVEPVERKQKNQEPNDCRYAGRYRPPPIRLSFLFRQVACYRPGDWLIDGIINALLQSA